MTDSVRESTEEQLARSQQRVRRLEAVVEASLMVNSTLDLPELAEHIIDIATRLVNAERGSLFLVDAENGSLQALVAQGRTVVSVLHEISMALQAQDLVILDKGQVMHQGACADAATHAALEAVFEHRLRIRAIDGQWLALPRLRGQAAAP